MPGYLFYSLNLSLDYSDKCISPFHITKWESITAIQENSSNNLHRSKHFRYWNILVWHGDPHLYSQYLRVRGSWTSVSFEASPVYLESYVTTRIIFLFTKIRMNE